MAFKRPGVRLPSAPPEFIGIAIDIRSQSLIFLVSSLFDDVNYAGEMILDKSSGMYK
jgi:hypothetical protein